MLLTHSNPESSLSYFDKEMENGHQTINYITLSEMYNESIENIDKFNYDKESHMVYLLQIYNGDGLLQMMSNNLKDKLDCFYIKEPNKANEFLCDFFWQTLNRNITKIPFNKNGINFAKICTSLGFIENSSKLNLQYEIIHNVSMIPKNYQKWLNIENFKSQCTQGSLSIMSYNHNKNNTKDLRRIKRDFSNWLIAPNTKWCGRGQATKVYNDLGGASVADKCCRKHDHCLEFIPGMTTRWQLYNYRPFTISHCTCDTRHPRDLSNLLRVPGTKWCGRGWSAVKYSELGGYSKADRCCRQHDKSCPIWIKGFETKYGLFNWRLNTLMHCKCDERLRTCLKMADSTDANMIGKLFFNVVQTKCFILKPEKICKRRSWQGKCEKKVLRKRAHLRENRYF